MPDHGLSLRTTARTDDVSPDAMPDARPLPLLLVCLLAVLVGIVTGLGAVVFRALIALVHNLLFLGHWSFYYDSSVFTPPPPWGRLGHPGARDRRASA